MRTLATLAAATLLAANVLPGLSLGPAKAVAAARPSSVTSAQDTGAGSKSLDAHAAAPTQVTIYDPDPQHLWNRLHRALWVRTGPDGREYGHDRLDPLLWAQTKYLVEGKSHELAIAVLDEFLAKRGEKLVKDPLKQAILQRDLWAVFDWTAEPGANTGEAHLRRVLQLRLARTIQRLALTPKQLKALPNNYAAAAGTQVFAEKHDPDQPERPFLPPDLMRNDGFWIEVEIDNGSAVTASRHEHDFGGRSTFRVFLRLPQGRKATVAYFDKLRDFPRPWVVPREPDRNQGALVLNPELPQFPVGTQAALVRQMLLVDKDGRIATTGVTESVQIRIFRAIPKLTLERKRHRDAIVDQDVYEFVRSRALLFADKHGGLRPLGRDDKDFKTQLMVHPYDEFERPPGNAPFERQMGRTKLSCIGCHDKPGIYSVLSYVGGNFPRGQYYLPVLQENTDADRQGELGVFFKRRQYSWGLLQGLWEEQPIE